ncbi:MAG TPA: hypothetical protein VNE62_04420 [Actinomycetota bacterium]|nr:hypothetical protein [Actinomycetota bacterium]
MWRRLTRYLTPSRSRYVFVTETVARAAASVDGVWAVHSMSIRRSRASLRVGIEPAWPPGTVAAEVENAVRRVMPQLESVTVVVDPDS